MKRIGLYAIALAMAAVLCACNIKDDSTARREQWLASAKLDAMETPAELYEAAQDEGTLVIYSISTRLFEVKKSFEAQYPGLTVEIRDVRSNDLINLLKEEAKNGVPGCDLIVYSDGDASLTGEMIPQGMLHKYTPPDMAAYIYPENNADQLVYMNEIQQVIYNGEVSAEPPLENWWELTEPRFYGRVYVTNPLRSSSTLGTFMTIIQHSDKMETAYLSLYGEPLAVPKGSSAGEVFIKRLFENGLVICNSSDEVAQAVGQPGQKSPAVGIIISSKIRLRDLGYQLDLAFGLEPFDGVLMPSSVMLTDSSTRVNTAKLFIRWMLGEADGHGEGYKPYLTEGTWSCRRDVAGESLFALEDLRTLSYDKNYLQKNRDAFTKQWIEWLGKGASGVIDEEGLR